MTIIFVFSNSLFAALPEAETKSFEAQYKLAKNQTLPMSARWKALLYAAEAAQGQQIQDIIAFAKDKDWFMRNASLVALEKMGTDIVYDQAKLLISDKALVVRSAAAEILMRLNNREVRKIFSDELSKKYNYNGKSSLWIRPQIMKYLAEKPKADERAFFVKYLFEKDTEIALMSVGALQKLTNIRFSGKNNKEVIAQWQKQAQKEKW